MFIGHEPNNALFKGVLAMDEHGYLITDRHMMTSVEGVFAAGEIQDPIWKQVATRSGKARRRRWRLKSGSPSARQP